MFSLHYIVSFEFVWFQLSWACFGWPWLIEVGVGLGWFQFDLVCFMSHDVVSIGLGLVHFVWACFNLT